MSVQCISFKITRVCLKDMACKAEPLFDKAAPRYLIAPYMGGGGGSAPRHAAHYEINVPKAEGDIFEHRH